MAEELVPASKRNLYSTAEADAQAELEQIMSEIDSDLGTTEERALCKLLTRRAAQDGNVNLLGSLLALSDKLATSARVSAQVSGRLVDRDLMLRFVRSAVDMIADEFRDDYSDEEFAVKIERIVNRLSELWEVTYNEFGEPSHIHGVPVSKVRK